MASGSVRRASWLLCVGLLASAYGSMRLVAAGRENAAPTTIWTQRGVSPAERATIAQTLAAVRPRIDADVGVHTPVLHVRIYAAHAALVRAARQLGEPHPQTDFDNTANIKHDTLLLGPVALPFLRHNLAHVYAEWDIDRRIGNSTDALPRHPWWYDGLAEDEAYRYEPAGMRCDLHTPPPFDVTKITGPTAWLAIRRGPFGSLAYCLAYLRVRGLSPRQRHALLRGPSSRAMKTGSP